MFKPNSKFIVFETSQTKQADRNVPNITFLSACFASCVAAYKEANTKKGASEKSNAPKNARLLCHHNKFIFPETKACENRACIFAKSKKTSI